MFILRFDSESGGIKKKYNNNKKSRNSVKLPMIN